MKTLLKTYCIILASSIYINSLNAEGSITLPKPGGKIEQIEIELGEQLTFIAEDGCASDFLIRHTAELEPHSFITQPFSFTFEKEGIYAIFCGCPSSLLKSCKRAMEIKVSSSLSDIQPVQPSEPIPTLGEWGLIILTLLVLNFGLIFIKFESAIRVQKEWNT